MEWASLLPAAAVVAIAVFLVKEALEFFRRRDANVRKLRALTALLARECELNYWTIRSLRRIIQEIPSNDDPSTQRQVEIKRRSSGKPYAQIVSHDGEFETHMNIPSVHRDLMSKFLLDIATLDKNLFAVMEPAYDALAEVDHVRESLVNIEDGTAFLSQQDWLAGFSGYALDELQEAEVLLGKLYDYCTGQPLTKFRLR